MKWRGVLSGALALIVLEVILTSPQTGRLAELLALPAAWSRKLIDPTVPAIADHRGATVTASTTATAPPGAFDPTTRDA